MLKALKGLRRESEMECKPVLQVLALSGRWVEGLRRNPGRSSQWSVKGDGFL